MLSKTFYTIIIWLENSFDRNKLVVILSLTQVKRVTTWKEEINLGTKYSD